MNRKQLLAALKAEGFTGDEKSPVETVQAFFAEKFPGGAIDEKTNEPIDVAKAWATFPPRRLSTPTEPDPATIDKAADVARTVKAAPAVHDGKSHSWARKMYEAKIKTGEAKIKDADLAEIVGAGCRSMQHTAAGLGVYRQADNDAAILANAGLEVAKTADGIALVAKAGSTAVNSLGGALVNTQFYDVLMWLTEQYGVSRTLARVVSMTSDIWKGKRKTAIPSFGFLQQGNSFTAQDVTYDNYSVVAEKAGAYVLTNSELEDDAAISVADDLGSSFAEGAAKKMDECYFLGDGTSTYGNMVGLISALPAGAYMNAAGGTWDSITEANVTQLMQVQNVNMARCRFVCSRQFDFVVLNRLRAAKGGTTSEMFSGGRGLASRDAQSFYMGFPVYHAQAMPSVSAATSTVLYFGETDAISTIGDRRTLTVKRSDATALQTDQIATLATVRFGVTVQGDGRGSTVGPVAALKTT